MCASPDNVHCAEYQVMRSPGLRYGKRMRTIIARQKGAVATGCRDIALAPANRRSCMRSTVDLSITHDTQVRFLSALRDRFASAEVNICAMPNGKPARLRVFIYALSIYMRYSEGKLVPQSVSKPPFAHPAPPYQRQSVSENEKEGKLPLHKLPIASFLRHLNCHFWTVFRPCTTTKSPDMCQSKLSLLIYMVSASA